MTAKELQKRNEKSQHLRVVQIDEEQFYVESSEGKICYRVLIEADKVSCTCGDFTRGVKGDVNFRCKHIVSVVSSIPSGEVQQGQVLERSKPKLNERFIIKIENKDFVQYAGLLDLGHQKGISQIEVDPIQLPTADNGNFAVCKATVVSKTGESFVDIGDCHPGNCSSKVSKHLLRMASTRAIARALRSFTNIGMTCMEELADLSDLAGGDNGNSKGKVVKQPERKPKVLPKDDKPEQTIAKAPDRPPIKGNGNGGTVEQKAPMTPMAPDSNGQKPTVQPMMSEAQKRAVWNLSRRRGISVEELQRMAVESYGVELEHLSSKDASSFIRNLQQAA